MRVISFLFFQCKTAFNINTCYVVSNTSQLLPSVWYWRSWNSKLLYWSTVFYFLGDFGQALSIRSCHKDVILTRKSDNCAGTAFVQEDSAGGSKLNEQTSLLCLQRCAPKGSPKMTTKSWKQCIKVKVIIRPLAPVQNSVSLKLMQRKTLNFVIKGMFGLLRFPLIFLFMKSKRANLAWACLITLSYRFYMILLPKRSHSPGKRQNWILLFYLCGRTSTHIENILLIWCQGSVAHCFNLLHNVRYRTTERTAPNRWQRFESSCSQSVCFFSIGSTRSSYHFHLLILFIWRGVLHLI